MIRLIKKIFQGWTLRPATIDKNKSLIFLSFISSSMDFRNVVQLRRPLLSDLQVSMHSKKSNKIIDTLEFTSSHTP